jgi:hypothetical protein
VTHGLDDATLQFGELVNFRRNIGRNTCGDGIESKASCEDVLQRPVVKITGDAFGVVDDIHIEEKYVPLSWGSTNICRQTDVPRVRR